MADSFWWHFSVDRFPTMDLSPGTHPGRFTAMMMKFMLNVAAITWMMSDSRMGLVLTYNVVGLMSNNLSQYTHEKLYYAHCAGSSMYICPNSLYIYTGWSFRESVMFC